MRRDQRKYVRSVLDHLEPLSKISSIKATQIVPLLSDNCIHKVCESCFNLLQNSYGLSNKKLNRIRRMLAACKKDIRMVSREKTTLLKKRKLLMRKQTGGGIFTILATTVIPALIAALRKK